jgi:hypothetical protein
MPTYTSTGIGASLIVAELDGTLSDEIQLRMGADQQEEAERIKHQLLNGRTLQERPFDNNRSMVGVLQFVGDERDMALFSVEAGESGSGSLGSLPTNVEPTLATASTIISHSLADSNPTSMVEPAQPGASRKKKKRKIGNDERSSDHDQIILLTTPPPNPKQSQLRTVTFDEPLALSLKVDCEEFIKSDDMQGKDLKIEVFLNGQLVDVTFENGRQPKSKGRYLYSGKRFHRQAEKPWIYVPGTASSNNGGLASECWANISQTLEDEAAQRGMDQKGQRPLSAQFLMALARLQLPDSVSARSGHFAVIDVVITAGKGHKYGSETSYITAPTRLFDGNFKGFFALGDDFGQHPHPYEYPQMHDAFVHMPFGDPGFSNFQTSDFINTQIPPSALLDMQYPVYPKQQTPPSPSPRTPKPGHKRTPVYREVLDATPIKKLLSNYENARGGRRTLRQRLGDMSKMSPKKRLGVMNELKKELDEKTMDTIKRAFEIDCLDSPTTTPSNNKVRFSSDVFDLRPVSGDDDDAEMVFDQPTNEVDAVDPYSFAYDFPPPQPQFLPYGSVFSQMPYFPQETGPFQQTMAPPTPAQWFAPNQQTMMLPSFEQAVMQSSPTQMLPSFEQAMMQSSPTQMLPPFQQTMTQPSPTQRSIPPKNTQASALSNSPIRLPVKKWPSQLRREALTALSDNNADEQQQPSIPLLSGAPTTPSAKRVGYGSKRSSSPWLPKEKKHAQALKDFQIPELCVGSAVSYAGGLQQRQVSKGRGGEFVEQQFVVGMRFVVL